MLLLLAICPSPAAAPAWSTDPDADEAVESAHDVPAVVVEGIHCSEFVGVIRLIPNAFGSS